MQANSSVLTFLRLLHRQVKQWCKARGLNDAPNGTPSSYCHALLVVFFLTHAASDAAALWQAPPLDAAASTAAGDGDAAAVAAAAAQAAAAAGPAAVLPNLQLVARAGVGSSPAGGGSGGAFDWVDEFDCRYCSDLAAARAHHEQVGGPGLSGPRPPRPKDERSVPELLLAYFAWLATLLDRAGEVTVSLRLGCLLRGRRRLWANGKAWRLSVEDPFEGHDCHKPHDLGQVWGWVGTQKRKDFCSEMATLAGNCCQSPTRVVVLATAPARS
jgi:hypothetical protein